MRAALIAIMFVLTLSLVACEEKTHALFREHETKIRKYAEEVVAGKIPKRADGEGFEIMNTLAAHGAIAVKKVGDCIVITFQSSPPDPIPELWYSPKGFIPLPTQMKEIEASRRSASSRVEFLRSDWAFCEWGD